MASLREAIESVRLSRERLRLTREHLRRLEEERRQLGLLYSGRSEARARREPDAERRPADQS